MKFMVICAVSALVATGLIGCSGNSGKKIKESKDYPFPEEPSPSS